MYTKQDLIGREFRTQNGRGPIHLFTDHKDPLYITITDHEDVKKGKDGASWKVSTVVSYINDGTTTAWQLIEKEEMKKKDIQVGDIVLIKESYKAGENAKVIRIGYKSYDLEHYNIIERTGQYETTSGYSKDDIEFVSRPSESQEIIGYELLKDLPNVKAGTQSNMHNGKSWGFALIKPRGGVVNMSIHEDDLKNTEWFKPLYKPTEVKVQVSGNRTVVIGATHVFIKGVGDRSFEEVRQLAKLINKFFPGNTIVETIRVGCQTFTRADVLSVFAALPTTK